MKKILILIIAAILFCLPPVHAEIQDLSLDFTISLSKVYVVEEVSYANKNKFNVELPSDASEVLVNVDGSDYKAENKTFMVEGKKIRIIYLTKKFIDKKNFIIDLTYPEDIKNLSISLHIPSNLELARPVEEKTLTSNAIFPKANSITTDGQRMKITWNRSNVREGDSISLLVMMQEKKDYSYIVYILVIVVVILLLYIFIRKPKIKTIIKTRTSRIEEHLKEDEEQIVRILKSRERQCEQGTLRVVTGFSKAKLSGLLQELEDRKIIYKEKRGKKNIIFLK
jgi:uncharacterized membrane protein